MRQHLVVGLGVHGLLADESDDVRAQPLVAYVRQHLLVDVHEPAFTGRQQQMQHIDRVRGERVARHPVQRSVLPGEGHLARLERDVLGLDGAGHPGLLVRHGVNVLTGKPRVKPSAPAC